MTTMNFLASAETSAAASAFGVRQAGQDIDVSRVDQFLRQALGDVGGNAADVLADEFKLFAGNHVAVLLDVKLDGVVHLNRRCRRIGRNTG